MTKPTNAFTIPATPGAEIACDLTNAPDTPEERLAEYGRLFAHALVARERVGSAIVFTFAAKPGVWDWVADLVHREAACCPFFSYEVEARDGHVVWKTSSEASPAALAMLDDLLAGPEPFGDGAGFLERLVQRDDVVSDGPTRVVLKETT